MTARRPVCAYVAEDGYQHLFPVRALQRVLPAPLLTTGRRMAARMKGLCEVEHVAERDLPARIGGRGVDVVISTSQRLHPSRLRSVAPGVRVVFVGHGESDKTHGQGGTPRPGFVHDPVNDAFDLVLVASRDHMEAYRNPDRVLVGYLKHDLFVADGYGRTPPRPDHVLWAPSWGRHNAAPEWLSRVVEATRALGLQCLIQLHPFSFSAEPGLVQRAYAESVRNPHVRIVETANVLDAMDRCALMLGDVSTVCYDWLLFDRPIVFLDHPGLVVEEEKRLFPAGTHVRPGDDLEEAIRAALADPGRKARERREALDRRYCLLDGHAAERALAAIEAHWTRWSGGGTTAGEAG